MGNPISFTAKSARFGLPYLFAGQAQKEFFVNQSVVLADSLLHAAIEGVRDTPPSEPDDGDCWLVGGNPEGDWVGHNSALACRQAGVWVMIEPRAGMQVFDKEAQQQIRYTDTWDRAGEPVVATGGTVIDLEARTTINNLIETLRIAGILPTQ